MKTSTKVIIGAGALLLVGLFVVVGLSTAAVSGKVSAGALDHTTLKKQDLSTSVSATGSVESATSRKIYSTVNYSVETVNVKLGDTVTAGQVLCTLDSSDLESQIAQKESSMQSSSVNTYFTLSQSEKRYNEARNNYDNGLNVELNNAKATLSRTEQDLATAKENLETAQKNLDAGNQDKLLIAKNELKAADGTLGIAKREYEKELNNDTNLRKAEVVAAEAARVAEKSKLSAAQSALKVAQLGDANTIEKATADVIAAQAEYDKAERKLTGIMNSHISMRYGVMTEAQTAYNEKKTALDSLLNTIGGDMATYNRAVDSAELAHNNAVVSYEATDLSALSQLDTYKTTMENDRASMSNEPQMLELDSLKKKLAGCTIASPIAGTVTAVNMTEGAPATGILFIVEDISTLKIDTTIKEYDIASIAVGMRATVTSDGTGDAEFEGVITNVAPTASKDSATTTFKAEITLSSNDIPLLIGMNTRVNIITDERSGIFGIRYDAVVVNADGKDVVYVARPGAGGSYTAEEVPVTIGLKTDFEVEISSDALKDGDIVITDITGITAGSTVLLKK